MWNDEWEQNKNYESPGHPKRIKFTWSQFINGLPDELPESINLWITGGLTRNGFTYNDIDWCMLDKETFAEAYLYKGCLNAMTEELFNRHGHVGNKSEDYHPAPIMVQVYENGRLINRNTLLNSVVEREERIISVKGEVHRTAELVKSFESRLKAVEDRLNGL